MARTVGHQVPLVKFLTPATVCIRFGRILPTLTEIKLPKVADRLPERGLKAGFGIPVKFFDRHRCGFCGWRRIEVLYIYMTTFSLFFVGGCCSEGFHERWVLPPSMELSIRAKVS